MTEFLLPGEERALQTQIESYDQHESAFPDDSDLFKPTSTPHKRPALSSKVRSDIPFLLFLGALLD
jgi:hypothetical protein